MKKQFTLTRAASSTSGRAKKQFLVSISSVTVLVLALACLTTWVRPEVLHPESDIYIVNHLSDKPFPAKIICPDAVDAGDYMGRPVSHLLEYVDSHVIYWLYLAGHPTFNSVIIVALLAAASIMFFALGLRTGVDRWILFLMVMLYWTDPNVFMSGAYFRDAKPAAAFFIFCAAFVMLWKRPDPTAQFAALALQPPTGEVGPLAAASPQARPRLRYVFCYFLLAAGACFSDPQGLFMVVLLAGLCLGWSVILRDLELAFAGIGGLIAALCHVVYLFWVGPWLAHHLTGFTIVNMFQHLRDPTATPASQHLWDGLMMNAQIAAQGFGNLRPELFLLLMPAAVALLFAVRPVRKGLILGSTAVLLLAASVLMWATMIGRHPPLLWADVSRSGYAIPTILLCLALLPLFTKLLMDRFQARQSVVIAVLVVLVLSNVSAIPSHIAIMKGGHLRNYFEITPVLLKELRHEGDQHVQGSNLVEFFKSKELPH